MREPHRRCRPELLPVLRHPLPAGGLLRRARGLTMPVLVITPGDILTALVLAAFALMLGGLWILEKLNARRRRRIRRDTQE